MTTKANIQQPSLPRFGRDELVYAMVLVGTRLEACDIEIVGNEIAHLAAMQSTALTLAQCGEETFVGLVAAYASATGRRPVEVPREALDRMPSEALWAEVSRICGRQLDAPSLLLLAPGPLAQAHLVNEADDGIEIVGQDMDQMPWDESVVGHEIAVANFEEPVEALDREQLSRTSGRLVLVARYD